MALSSPNRAIRSRENPTGARAGSSPLSRYGSNRGEDSPAPQPKGSWSFLLLLLPVLCCGGPVIVLGLAAAGTIALGITAGVVVALAAVATLIIVRRRRASNCCKTSV